MTHRRKISVVDDVFHIPVICVWDVEGEQFAEVMMRYYGVDATNEHTNGGMFNYYTIDGREVGVIAMSGTFSGTPDEFALLAHECLHCALHMLGSRGLDVTPASEETYCYYLGFLISSLSVGMLKVERQIARG